MKKQLDTTKVYYLGDLTEEQREELFKTNFEYKKDWEGVSLSEFKKVHKDYIFFVDKEWDWSELNDTDTEPTNAKELFEPQYEVKYIAEKPEHYSHGIDTFSRMEANCTKEECLAFAKGNIDKYNFRKKGQDLEDFKKIIAYAEWAIKLLNK